MIPDGIEWPPVRLLHDRLNANAHHLAGNARGSSMAASADCAALPHNLGCSDANGRITMRPGVGDRFLAFLSSTVT